MTFLQNKKGPTEKWENGELDVHIFSRPWMGQVEWSFENMDNGIISNMGFYSKSLKTH